MVYLRFIWNFCLFVFCRRFYCHRYYQLILSFEKLSLLGYIFYYCTFMSLRFLQLHFTSTCKKVRQRSRLKIKAISKVREKGSVKIFSRKYFFDIHVPQQYRNLLLFFSDPPLHKDVAVGV